MTHEEALDRTLAAVARGERAAFDELYRQTAPQLFAVSLRILRNRADAEEALQDAYLKIWSRAGSYAPTGAGPFGWLAAIARHAAIDRLRRRRAETSDAALASIADNAESPEQTAIAASEAGRLDACLSALPPDRAAIIRKAYFGGLTYSEIAQVEGAPLGTVKSWIRRGLRFLRSCLDGAGAEATDD